MQVAVMVQTMGTNSVTAFLSFRFFFLYMFTQNVYKNTINNLEIRKIELEYVEEKNCC